MNWRRFVRTRGFHALWIGAVLLALAIWFDVVWIAVLMVFFIAAAVMFIDWLISLWKGESSRMPPDN